jgi:hypothetical protein
MAESSGGGNVGVVVILGGNGQSPFVPTISVMAGVVCQDSTATRPGWEQRTRRQSYCRCWGHRTWVAVR